jgi:hypothetical protein
MIYIIITTSINSKFGIQDNIHRQNRYIKSISQLLQLIHNDLDIKPIIVENNGFRRTYLDGFKCDICYTDNNKIQCVHKGENELLDIKEVINKYNIKDDDTIVKLTGRYKFLNSNFINLVKKYNNHYDAFVKFFNVRTKKYTFDACVLGLFAIKCKYLKEFKYNFLKSYDFEFADYITKNINKNKLIAVKQLDLECCFAENLKIQIV